VKPVLSLVIPIYNDGKLAEPFCEEVVKVLSSYFQSADLDELLEVIFVDDGSFNDSVDYLKRLAQRFRFVKVVELSRNFGHHVAISCGFQFSSGDYVTSFDVDMQDPPAELPKLLDHIKQGNCDVVQGIRPQRQDRLINRITSNGFVWLFNKIAGFELPQNCSAMRIMNRSYINAFNRYTEKVRYALGLEYWLGFKRDFIEIGHMERPDGSSSYNLKRRATLALEAIISFSDMPLKLSIYTGCSFAIVGVLLGIWFIAMKFLLPSVLPGFTSIIALLLFSQGIVLMMLGVTGLYIGRILKEVQNRPLYVVRQTYNFQSD
jgi:dolichol-phosphate mannosyltransferase